MLICINDASGETNKTPGVRGDPSSNLRKQMARQDDL
jgi:hypothetical protein